MNHLHRRFLIFIAALPVTGCRDPGMDPPDGIEPDAGDAFLDGPIIPEDAILCTEDSECDDGVLCTRDLCTEVGYCQNPTDRSVCDDGVFCNGAEVCDPDDGCVPGPLESCNDNEVCTVDRCDEDLKMCVRSPRDFDEDGEADWHCEDGTDCDDQDPRRAMTVAEVCDDGVDNDCDEEVDEEDCGLAPYDACDDPLDVTGGGSFDVSTLTAAHDFSLSCGGSGDRDVVLSLTLDEPKDLRITAEADSVATGVAIRTTCEDRESERKCNRGFPGEIRTRALGSGTYFIIVSSSGGATIRVEVEVSDPTPLPENDQCSGAIDVSAGGAFAESFVDVQDDYATSCGVSETPDLTYVFTTTEVHDVRIALANEGTAETLAVSVRSNCDDEDSQLRCARGAPIDTRLHELPAGTYFLIVEGSAFREVDFTLTVDFLDGTPPPAGENCTFAIPLTLDEVTDGTLVGAEDDVDISCGFFNPDTVYTFELEERRDVTVLVDGGSAFMRTSVRTMCADAEMELRCQSGRPARTRLRDLAPGPYAVIVESFSSTNFTVLVETSPPTPVTEVSGNDTCGTAFDVPQTGGLFAGTTTVLINDLETSLCGFSASSNDAVFRLDVATPIHVVASTEGSEFDTVLHMHETECATREEEVCDDDGGDGDSSLIERTLSEGAYFFVVDGFGATNNGDYYFEVIVSDP